MPKLVDRQIVEGTDPSIYLGHRLLASKNGSAKPSKKWIAEYCVDARQRYERLGTSNKNIAIRLAHDIAKRIQSGEPQVQNRKAAISDLVSHYMEYQLNKGRAPKTLEKYKFILNSFTKWATA